MNTYIAAPLTVAHCLQPKTRPAQIENSPNAYMVGGEWKKRDSSIFPKLILPSTVDRTRVWRDPLGPLLPFPPPSDVRKIVRARKGEKCTQRGEYKRIACKGVRDDCRHCCSEPTAAVCSASSTPPLPDVTVQVSLKRRSISDKIRVIFCSPKPCLMFFL